MTFNFQKFVEQLRQDESKKEVVVKYERFFGNISGDIKDQLWYKQYVSTFQTFTFSKPEKLKDDFDWDLLCQLVAASFSSHGTCLVKNKQLELLIDVQNKKQSAKKLVSELLKPQILRLYEIYCEEGMNLQILIAEDDEKFGDNEKIKNEKRAIQFQRKIALEKWNKELQSIEAKKYISTVEDKILSYLE